MKGYIISIFFSCLSSISAFKLAPHSSISRRSAIDKTIQDCGGLFQDSRWQSSNERLATTRLTAVRFTTLPAAGVVGLAFIAFAFIGKFLDGKRYQMHSKKIVPAPVISISPAPVTTKPEVKKVL